MGVKERYEERKKKKEKTGYSGVQERSFAREVQNAVSTIPERTSVWLLNHNNYLKNYNDRFSNRSGTYKDSYVSDAGDWLSTVTAQKENFDKEANNILAMLDKYGDYLDEDWAESIRSTLAQASSQQADILKTAAGDRDYWAQFASQDEYGVWQTNQGYLSKYAGKSYNDIQAALEGLADGEEKNWLTTNKYSLMTTAEDYAENSQYKSTADGSSRSFFQIMLDHYPEDASGFGWTLYDAINGNEDAKAYLSNQGAEYYGTDGGAIGAVLGRSSEGKTEARYMSETEVGIFNYLYATQGQEAAQEFYDYLQADLNARQMEANEAYWTEYAKEDSVAASAFSILTSPMKGLSAVGQIADYIGTGKIDENAGYNSFARANGAMRNQVSADVEAKWGGVGSFAYNIGMSMADFLFTTAVSGGNQTMSLAIMGSGAAADTTISAKQRGLSDNQAFMLGTVAGVAEVAMEKIGLDALFNTDMLSKSSVKYIINNALSEGFEEVGTDVVNTIADCIIAQDKSQWQVAINAYMSEGKTAEEAFAQAVADKALELGLSFAGGALSGGVIGGGSAAINAGVNAHNAKQTYGDYAQALVNEALEIDPGNTFAQKMQGRLDSGKELSGSQLNKLVQQNETTMVAQDMASIQSAAAQRLTELGESGDVNAIAAALAKQAKYQSDYNNTVRQFMAEGKTEAQAKKLADEYVTGLTNSEKNTIAKSEYGQRLANELNAENIQGEGYSSQWAESLGTNRINAQEYSRMLEADPKLQKAQEKADVEPAQAEGSLKTGSLTMPVNSSSAASISDNGQKVDAELSVSEDGKTYYKNEAVSVSGIASISEDGSMKLKLEDGRTVDAEEVSYGSADEAVMYETLANTGMNATAANMLLSNYEAGSGLSAAEYAKGVEAAYIAGTMNYPMADVARMDFVAQLAPDQRKMAYQLGEVFGGKQTAKEQAAVRGKAAGRKTDSSKGQVHFDGDRASLNDKQKASLKVMEALSKTLGVQIYVYESRVGADGRRIGENGWYDPSDGSIHIDLYAGADGKGTMLFTLAHELTHFIRQWSPAKFKVLANFLMKQYGEQGISVDELVQNQIAKAKRNGRELTQSDAYEEVVADSMEQMLVSGNVVQMMADLRQQDRTLWEKIRDWFKDFADKLKAVLEAYKGVKPDSTEGKLVASMREDITAVMECLYAAALADASENFDGGVQKNTTEDSGGVKYSQGRRTAQADVTLQYQAAVDQILNMQNTNKEHLIIGYTPDVYTSLGMPSLPFVIGSGHVYSATKTEAEARQDGNFRKGVHYHGLGADTIKNIYKSLANPVMIIASKDVNKTATPLRSTHSVVAVIDIGNAEKSLLLPVEITAERTVNGVRMDVNALSSVYEKGVAPLIQEAIAKENAGDIGIYYAKKEALTLPGAGVQFPIRLQQSIASKGIIHRFVEKVNMNIQDVTQSRQFKKWFGDWQNQPEGASKIVNADGTPKVMYHGSPAQFTVFDKKKAKSSGLYGKGFYFTDSVSHAGTYGQKYAVYLNIRNPLSPGKNTVSNSQLHSFLKVVAENEDYSIENYGTYDIDAILKNVLNGKTKADAFQILQDINATAIGDLVEAVELFNKVNGTKFDGIVVPTETVAFYPEQIKSATDNIGTFDKSNPDIRYSMRDGDYQAVAQAVEKENAKLREDVAKLRELVSLQRQVTGGTKFTKASVEAAAQYLKRNADAKGDTKELAGLLNTLYEYIAASKELTWEGVKEQTQPAVDWLQEHTQVKSQRSEYAQDVLDQLRGRRVRLDESQMAEAAYHFGSYADYRKGLFGNIIISKDANTSLDSLWQELSEQFPDVFDSQTTSADMPGALADVIHRLRNADTTMLDYARNSEMIAQDLLQQVYDSYWRVSTLRTVADVKQRQINRLKGEHYQRMAKLREYHQTEVAKLKQAQRERLEKVREEYRNQSNKKVQEITQRHRESRQRGIEGRRKTAMRHKIRGVVDELNQYLLKGTKERHVPIGLQKAVAEALDAVNMDTVGADERIARLNDELLKAKTPKQIQEISRKIDRVREMGGRMDERLNKLKAAYDEFINSDDPIIANSHDEGMSAHMMKLIVRVGDTSLRDMTVAQLQDVYDVYQIVLATIRNANKSFKDIKNREISTRANQVMAEIDSLGVKRGKRPVFMDWIAKFGWDGLKPVYAMEHIGSKELIDAFNNLRAGEDTWARDIVEAREFYLEKFRKYKYDSWDFEKKFKFTSTTGMDFELTLDQIMSLYAYAKRNQAADHLRCGGIVFDPKTAIKEKTKFGIKAKYNVATATAYNLSKETLGEIISKLTDEQKGFADEMQAYLSDVMGEKGNEVSLAMYDVKLFREKNYFPLKSATQYMAKAREQAQGDVKIKNSGFTNETKPHAKNPIVLSSFMDVWAYHVNEMSMYHAFVLPMEDFYRIYNYTTPSNNENLRPKGVNPAIENAFGTAATGYIEQMLNDLNGGARTDPRAGFISNMMGKFKKGAVFASLSVVAQQPSAIARAAALVDTKYFIGPKVDHKKHKALWAEVKQYAPVAIIKEMGYFDTNIGKSTQDFIMGKEYAGIKEKTKALVRDSNYRDEVFSKLPALADEVAWCGIWEAVKRETHAKHPGMDTKSEAFLKIVGERFTEVITKTQVYDSVLSRSALMRSKDTGLKMATAFMAEPTTSINMVADALLKGKRGDRKYCRTAIGAVIASQILNSILVSFVYAARDDDEDQTYLEKYIESLTGEILDGLNPLTYIPFIKDIISIVQGYDVERSDMAVISDLWSAWQKLTSDKVSVYRKVEGFAGSVAQLFGLPVKNIMRDARGIYQTVESFMNDQRTTAAGIGYAVKSAVPKWLGGGDVSNQQQLYEAYLSGNKTQIARVESRFKDQSAINQAIRKALRENDSRIWEAAMAWNSNNLEGYKQIAEQIIAEGCFSQDNVVMAIRAEANAMIDTPSGNSTDNGKGYFTAEKFVVAIVQGNDTMADVIKADIIDTAQKNGKTLEEANNSFTSLVTSACKDSFNAGHLSDEQAVEALMKYCGKAESDALGDVACWDFGKNHPDVDIQAKWFDTYYEKVAISEIDIDTYVEYRNQKRGLEKRDEILEVIDAQPISKKQKDALYLAEGYAESTLYKTPWH